MTDQNIIGDTSSRMAPRFLAGNYTGEAGDGGNTLPAAAYIAIVVVALCIVCGCCLMCFIKFFYGSMRNFWNDLRHGNRDGATNLAARNDRRLSEPDDNPNLARQLGVGDNRVNPSASGYHPLL